MSLNIECYYDPQNATTDDAVGEPLVAIQNGLDVSVTFVILSGNSAGVFKIGYCTGQLRVQLPVLNYNLQNTYVLSVAAQSNGLTSSQTVATITISVLNVPHVPVFNSTTCSRSISENSKLVDTATENVHALEGLACRKRIAPASSPAAPASRVRRSRRLRSTLAAAPGLLAHALVTKQVNT